ncbi:MAG: Tungsten-containing formylmethanofuran dehydrogenase 2 subunit C [Methanosaeta sp. PtaU1.Bin112]|nr:MAG: Tungsten-containing formylmethanofuran dehydrogenase 2 subunit C [Methanosaeta sp. PtaU1.Bin112]
MARAAASQTSVGADHIEERIAVAEIDATGLQTKELNDQLRDLLLSGIKKVNIRNVCGQRYIGTRLYTPEHLRMEIEIFGTPGNDLAAFLYGHKITVHGNAQDGVGNTMDGGEVIVKGRAGDVLAFSMRGGEIYVRDNCGYRTALHMKEYEDKKPVLVVGGCTQDFLGEYMAGGIVIILNLLDQTHKANFIGTGMHGGVIYLRGQVEPDQLGGQVEVTAIEEPDRSILDRYVSRFLERFPEIGMSQREIMQSQFYRLKPKSKRPYSNLYTY